MFGNFGKLIYWLKMMAIIILVLAPNLSHVAYCEETDEAKIIILRPGNEDEDDFDMMLDSVIVAEIEPRSRNEINVSSGKHWLIFRYGPRRFPEYRPKYYGSEILIAPDEVIFLKASFRSWAKQFYKFDIDRLNDAEAERLSADSVMGIKVFALNDPIKTIRAREYRNAIDELAEEAADSSVFRYSPSGIKIRVSKSDSGTIETDTASSPARTKLEIEDDIKGARTMLVIGVPILCLGATTATVAYSFVIPKVMVGKTADDLPTIIGFGGLVAIGGGFALTKIGNTRLKRFRQELDDHSISLQFGINEICIAIDF